MKKPNYNKILTTTLLLSLAISTCRAQVYARSRVRNTLLNTTYYVGTSYEYSYDETYWTVASIKYYNSSFNGTWDIFVQTSYQFYKHWWAGSDTNSIVFRIDPVSYLIFNIQSVFLGNFFLKKYNFFI